jgi:thioredoxin 1
MEYINPALKGKELWYFYADWCPYCQQQNPIMDQFESDNPDILVIRINSEESDALEINGVSSFPTFMVFKHGDFLTSLNGLTQKDALAEAFN